MRVIEMTCFVGNDIFNMLRSRLVQLFAILLITLFLPICLATETNESVKAGAKEFQQRCALCHGNNGKGNGPYAFALVYKPSDLTKLSIENNGQFPFLETYSVIDGREIAKAHGTRLMPIWGDRYTEESWSKVSPEHAKTLVRGKIFELLLFLNSIQETSQKE